MNSLIFKEDVIIEHQNNYLRNFSQHDSSQHQSRLSAAHKIKRSLSHRRKLVNKLPLIKKEIEIESNVKQKTELLIQSIIDCDLTSLKKALENGIYFNVEKIKNLQIIIKQNYKIYQVLMLMQNTTTGHYYIMLVQ